MIQVTPRTKQKKRETQRNKISRYLSNETQKPRNTDTTRCLKSKKINHNSNRKDPMLFDKAEALDCIKGP